MKNFIISILNKLPYIRTLNKKLLFYENSFLVPPGHFYSPIVNSEDLFRNEKRIFDLNKKQNGIELYKEEQFDFLKILHQYYSLLPFTDTVNIQNRYYYKNDAFEYADAIFLFGIIMHYKPKRIIEIGSGYSSALMLDVNEKYFQNSIDITFVEPFPSILSTLSKTGDCFTLIEKNVQDVNIEFFKNLEENDILFIDSTHVAKTNSDVLFEIFEILPSLRKGVKIHIHDIFFPFEYPKDWVLVEKRSWNEIYFLKAFLMYNDHFKILAFNTYLEYSYNDWFEKNMPLCLKNTGGSIWIEKVI